MMLTESAQSAVVLEALTGRIVMLERTLESVLGAIAEAWTRQAPNADLALEELILEVEGIVDPLGLSFEEDEGEE